MQASRQTFLERAEGVVSNGRRSLATDAYDRLRDSIVRGELRPNQRLVETEVAEWLKVSRTPLREALARLASDGMVAKDRRGWTVHEHTAEEIREINEVRAALEGMAALLTCERGEDDAIEKIVNFHDAQNRAKLEMSNSDYLVEYNDSFHRTIVDASGNARLQFFVSRNREFFFSHRIARLFSDQDAAASLKGHDEIVAALAARDGEAAERAMRDHILSSSEVILSKLY